MMLNKIWAGLIIVGILFALAQDISDEINNPYHNNIVQKIAYSSVDNSSTLIKLTINNIKFDGEIKNHQQVHIFLNESSPLYLLELAALNGNDNTLTTTLMTKSEAEVALLFPPLHWRKLRSITQAAFDMAKFAARLALGLIGIMALWLGLMQIAEKSGLIYKMVKVVQPLLQWLFPNIPKDHPAFGSISMNMAANILGLGNAATPLGIKAMQQLQTLNPHKDRASDEMCMFLALNTSSVQLLPPVTLIALMGTQVSELIVPIILATSCSTIAAVTTAKLYAKYRGGSCSN